LKKPDRELLAKEKKRLRASLNADRTRSKLGPFALWSRIFAVGAPLLLIGLVAATFFTPLLAIDQIKVVGAERVDEKKVSKALSSLEGRSLTTISESEVAELLGDFALIETFALQAQPPHTLIVKLREREPILALVRAGNSYLYDAAGVQIEQAKGAVDLPYLLLSAEPLESPQFDVAVEVLLSLPIETYRQVFSIEVSEQLTVQFTLKESNISVIWGDTNESLLKDEVLQSLLATGLEDSVVVDVSSPNAPVVTYPNF
jgi:cell division protein FtsQ